VDRSVANGHLREVNRIHRDHDGTMETAIQNPEASEKLIQEDLHSVTREDHRIAIHRRRDRMEKNLFQVLKDRRSEIAEDRPMETHPRKDHSAEVQIQVAHLTATDESQAVTQVRKDHTVRNLFQVLKDRRSEIAEDHPMETHPKRDRSAEAQIQVARPMATDGSQGEMIPARRDPMAKNPFRTQKGLLTETAKKDHPIVIHPRRGHSAKGQTLETIHSTKNHLEKDHLIPTNLLSTIVSGQVEMKSQHRITNHLKELHLTMIKKGLILFVT
jgi:hypothetical protein